MMMLAAAAAVKCPYCQTYHKAVSKNWGASNEELNELAGCNDCLLEQRLTYPKL
jgi:AhpD family alkylhydroperoxidase